MNARVLDSIKKSAAVPSIPQVVSRFLQIMQDPQFKYPDLVKALSADAGTVSEVLRLVNSALFGVRQKIISLQQALTLLGPKRTRSLLLGRYLVDTMNQKAVPGLDMAYFWRRSLASSVVSLRFAEVRIPSLADEAFIGGLLADIGIPILTEFLPEGYRGLARRYAPLGEPLTPEEELIAVEVTHAQVSAMVLKHWTLPEAVCTAVNLSHSTNPGHDDHASLAKVLSAADRIAKLLCEVSSSSEIAVVCTQAVESIGIDLSVLLRLLGTIENDIEELAEALRIDVIPGNVYSLIAQTIQQQLAAPACRD